MIKKVNVNALLVRYNILRSDSCRTINKNLIEVATVVCFLQNSLLLPVPTILEIITTFMGKTLNTLIRY